MIDQPKYKKTKTYTQKRKKNAGNQKEKNREKVKNTRPSNGRL